MKTIEIRYFIILFTCFIAVSKSKSINRTGQAHKGTKKHHDTTLIYNLTSGIFYAEEVSLSLKRVHKLVGVHFAHVQQAFRPAVPFQSNFNSKQIHLGKLSQHNLTNSWPPVCLQAVMFNHNFYGENLFYRIKKLTINSFVLCFIILLNV
jgi:hypothetical protein